MFNLKIRGFRCNEETDGTGSDAIGMFLAALPVRKHSWGISHWSYAEGPRSYRVRWAGDMDTGEAFEFRYPMSINQTSSDFDALEIIMMMFEIDGGSSTKNQALEEHWAMRKNIERDFQPGVRLGSFPGNSNNSYKRILPWIGWDSNEAFGAGEDIVGLDLWHIDLDRPLEGSISWEEYTILDIDQWTPDRATKYFQRKNSIERDLYKGRRADGGLSETRSYRSNAEDSRYTFEVEYTDV